MQNVILILYLLLFSIISEFLWIFVSKRKEMERKKIQFIKEIMFFFCCILFIVSAVKWFLGDAERTLFESFWDIETRTYINYGMPLLVIALLMPLILYFMFRLKSVRMVEISDAFLFIGLVLGLIMGGGINNSVYCISFVGSMIVSLIFVMISKKEVQYIKTNEYKLYILNSIPTIVVWITMVGILLPSELYLNNYHEFSGSYWMFLSIMLCGSLLCGAGYIVVTTFLLPKVLYKLVNLGMACIACMGYLQIMILNGEMKALDGVEQTWSVSAQVINALIWLLALIVVLNIGLRKAIVEKICQGLCLYIALIQVVTMGYLLLTTDFRDVQNQKAMTTQGSLELAESDNILIFVLDSFDSSWFEEIVEEDDSIIEQLADFTYYRNGTSQFAHTNNALPYMLTGVQWNESVAEDYYDYAYEHSDVVKKLFDCGYNMGIYTAVSYVGDNVRSLTTNYSESEQLRYEPLETFMLMVKTSMYKMVPFVMKPQYAYYSGDVYSLEKSNNIWNIDNDFPFYYSLLDDGLSVNNKFDRAFRFYHMRGPHGPFYLSEDLKYEVDGDDVSRSSQARGSLKIVYEYMEQMKNLGIYDAATIIITADHGQGYILDSDKTSGKPDRTSRPLFLVKKPNEQGEAMAISEAPVSQAELLPTVLEAAGMEWHDYGRTFDEIPEDEQRERFYVDVYDYFQVQYVINGDASDLNCWEIKDAIYHR